MPAPETRRSAVDKLQQGAWIRRYASVVGMLVLALAACNRDVCLGLHQPTQDRNAPQLIQVELLDREDANPWVALFALDFADRDGDLGNGNVLIYVGASTPLTLPLSKFFETSELPLNSVSGRVGLPLSLTPGSVPDDSLVRFGFQLQDSLGHFSGCYVTDLHFDLSVADFAFLPPRRLQRVACRSWSHAATSSATWMKPIYG